MSLEFIPNQPIIFEKPIGDFPCLNNDNKTYGQLLQDGDELCIQWKLAACNEPMCEPNMEGTAGPDELGAWTATGGWASTGSDNLSFDGTGNPAGDATQSLAGLTVGAVYRLTFDVTTYTGLVDYTVGFIGSPSVTIDGLGTYTVYFIAGTATPPITISHNGTSTAADTLEIENLESVQWTACWQDGLNFSSPTWSYSFDGANGKFCSLDQTGGDLINTNAISAPGTYHGVRLTVSDCTQGGVIVTLGGTTIGSQTSGNGEFTFYGVPAAGVDLVISKADNFDGCISQVKVYDYGDIDQYQVHFETDDATTFSADYSVVAYEDRIVWCNNLSDLTWTVDGVPDAALTCKQLKTFIYDPCEATEYESVNYINYKNDGWECTKLVESWSDGYAFGFYFGDINAPDFKLRQRLRFLAFNPVYRNAGEEYLYSSGNTGRSFAQSQKARTAWFDYMDEYAHDCTRVQLLGQKLFIDNYAFYFPTEDYEPEWNERGAYNLAQARVTLFHEEAIFGTTCGTMANAVCPPQVVVTPPAPYTQVIVNVDAFDTTPLDVTQIQQTNLQFDNTGTCVNGGGGGSYDLTNGVDRALLAAAIANALNTAYGTTTTSTSCTLSGSLLTLNIICTGTIGTPMPAGTIAVYDVPLSASYALPITFA